MSGSATDQVRRGATAGDCARLWSTIQKDLVSDAQLRIIPRSKSGDDGYLEVCVTSPSLHQVDGSPAENVWAQKEFHNGLHLISVGQLFEMLIVAYRVMDRYFEVGDAAAPPRRVI